MVEESVEKTLDFNGINKDKFVYETESMIRLGRNNENKKTPPISTWNKVLIGFMSNERIRTISDQQPEVYEEISNLHTKLETQKTDLKEINKHTLHENFGSSQDMQAYLDERIVHLATCD